MTLLMDLKIDPRGPLFARVEDCGHVTCNGRLDDEHSAEDDFLQWCLQL
jgi:hypothetical protein